MKNTVIYLVRHGESLGNMNSCFLGHTDLDLSPKGYEQARLTADVLSDVHFDAIYSSDLIRAYNTALPHAKMRNLEIHTSEKLREIYAGDWEGRHVDDIIANWRDPFVLGWRRNFGTFTIPGGECVIDAAKRFALECAKIAQNHKGECLLITAHAAVIRSFWGFISGVAPEDMADAVKFPSNASYSILEYDGESFIPKSYSNDEHMGDLLTTVNVKYCGPASK